MAGYKFHNGERNIGGTAALLHKIKQDGGLEAHYEKVIRKVVPDILDAMIKEENQNDRINSIKLVK